jgi:hypothetical protein
MAVSACCLTGCSARVKSAIDRCEMQAKRRSPAELLTSGNDLSPFMATCMAAKGYKLNLFRKSCVIDINSERKSGCYGALKSN